LAAAYSTAWGDALLGAAVRGVRLVYRSTRPVARTASVALRLTAGQVLGPGTATLAAHGEQARADLERLVDPVLAVVVRRVVNTLLETVDLTALVRENVDLVGLAADVVDAIDLPWRSDTSPSPGPPPAGPMATRCSGCVCSRGMGVCFVGFSRRRAAACVAFPAGLLWVAVSRRRRRRSIQDVLLRTVVVYERHVSPDLCATE
jgi:hypothetical protein